MIDVIKIAYPLESINGTSLSRLGNAAKECLKNGKSPYRSDIIS